MKKLVRCLALGVALQAWSTRAQLPIIPDWSYDQANNVGFFDPSASPVGGFGSIGELRRTVFTAAANYVSSLFTQAYVTEVVRVKAAFTNLGTGTVGSGGTIGYTNNFGSTNPKYKANVDYTTTLANHVAGRELFSVNTLAVNFNTNAAITFNYSTNDSAPLGSGQESLFTTVVHELIHGMGFVNYINAANGSFDGFPTAYDTFIVEDNGNPVSYAGLTDAQRLVAITNNNLFWNGPLGVAGNNGVRPKLSAPAPYSASSSIAHLDTGIFDPLGLLLLPRDSSLVQAQVALVALERGMLYDMGFTPARPQVLSIASSSGNHIVTATGILNAKYRLRFTGTLTNGVNATNWTALASTVRSGWNTVSLTNTPTGSAGFYAVEIVP
ncbi:MAG: hypothetical protein HZA92_08155 [Verrucomicrobia bacterium]|nr:hypothetical protein [Verrucomicrobiota bacterium]